MGRLIDVDEAIKQLDHNTWQGEMLIAILKGLPTAYDVDKVVEQLANAEFETSEEPHAINTFRAIEIVKGGAVKDE